MITLNASGGSVTFTFSGNSTYLNDGTITVPVNSLALIIDESNMATFKKAASNDIFVSANIAEFGMTKAELESWYKENAVGSTGGGGTDTGTVQTMIDESISGKADSSAVTEEISAAVSGKANSSDVYTTGQTSGATEIANALSGKQDTLIAGENITISGNVISAQGGGCEVEETVIYNRYTSPYYDYDGGNKVTYAVLDYLGDKSTTYGTQFFFNVGNSSTEYESWMTFDYVNHSANTESLSDYVTVEYVSDIQDFKVSIATDYQSDWWIRQIAGLDSDKNALVPFYTINSGSPCTVISTDVVGLVKKVKDIADSSLNDANIQGNKENLAFSIYRSNGYMGQSVINLEDLDGSNNTLKPNINIPLGVSGWTEVDFNGNSCQYGNGSPLGFTTFRISGDTNELYNWGLQIAAGWDSSYEWDAIQWDDNQNTFVRTTNRSDDVFSAATVNWDSNTGYLTITYPTSVTVDGETKQTSLFFVNSQNCQYGYAITKFEYYSELKQPLKPYVQETRAALGGLSLSHVTQAQYDAMEQAGTLDSNTLYVITNN